MIFLSCHWSEPGKLACIFVSVTASHLEIKEQVPVNEPCIVDNDSGARFNEGIFVVVGACCVQTN